jgi:hypothetical protein
VEGGRPVSGDVGCAASRAEQFVENPFMVRQAHHERIFGCRPINTLPFVLSLSKDDPWMHESLFNELLVASSA